MNMKSLFFSVSFILLTIFGVSSCTGVNGNIPENLDENTTKTVESINEAKFVIGLSNSYLLGEEYEGIQEITEYINKDKKTVRSGVSSTEKVSEEDALSEYLSEFLSSNNISIYELEAFIESNPEKERELFEYAFSESFVYYHDLLMRSIDEEEYMQGLSLAIENGNFTYTEKAFLVLLTLDVEDGTLRGSFKCKARRYAKLTKIALSAIAISFIDGVDEGVEHATEELQEMRDSGEYKC